MFHPVPDIRSNDRLRLAVRPAHDRVEVIRPTPGYPVGMAGSLIPNAAVISMPFSGLA